MSDAVDDSMELTPAHLSKFGCDESLKNEFNRCEREIKNSWPNRVSHAAIVAKFAVQNPL